MIQLKKYAELEKIQYLAAYLRFKKWKIPGAHKNDFGIIMVPADYNEKNIPKDTNKYRLFTEDDDIEMLMTQGRLLVKLIDNEPELIQPIQPIPPKVKPIKEEKKIIIHNRIDVDSLITADQIAVRANNDMRMTAHGLDFTKTRRMLHRANYSFEDDLQRYLNAYEDENGISVSNYIERENALVDFPEITEKQITPEIEEETLYSLAEKNNIDADLIPIYIERANIHYEAVNRRLEREEKPLIEFNEDNYTIFSDYIKTNKNNEASLDWFIEYLTVKIDAISRERNKFDTKSN